MDQTPHSEASRVVVGENYIRGNFHPCRSGPLAKIISRRNFMDQTFIGGGENVTNRNFMDHTSTASALPWRPRRGYHGPDASPTLFSPEAKKEARTRSGARRPGGGITVTQGG